MKILITSDNHLGFKERDNIRAYDSYLTFTEILTIGEKENVDLILQAGDLFDISSPSRLTLNTTICILKHFIIEKETESTYLNICRPIVAIHGNHDDPSGLGRISPMEILHSAGLINYIGKINSYENIEIEPVYFEKQRVAIYGIGYFSDKKFLRLLNEGKIKFKKYSNTVNILMLHQNRSPIYKNYISENNFNEFFDLIIYGHEHEPIQLENRYGVQILQCGSSVQTSLCEGEVGKKYAYIANIRDGKITIERRELETPREFYFNTYNIVNMGEKEKENFIHEKLSHALHKNLCKKINYFSDLLSKILNKNIIVNSNLPLCRLRFQSDEIIQRSLFDEFNEKFANIDFISYVKLKSNNFTGRDERRDQSDFQFNNEFADMLFTELKNENMNIIDEQLIIDGYLNIRKGYFDKIYSKLSEQGESIEIIDDENIKKLKSKVGTILYENKLLD